MELVDILMLFLAFGGDGSMLLLTFALLLLLPLRDVRLLLYVLTLETLLFTVALGR